MAAPKYNVPITATDKTAAAFKSVMGSAGKLASAAAKIGLTFATAGTAAAAALTKMSMQNIDALAKTSDRLGIATQSLAGLQHAANLAGVENKTLEKSLQNLAIGVSDAADGSGIAKDALIELGLSAATLEKMPVDAQMMKVADAMQGVELQADKVRIATELFGSRGVKVLNMIGGGASDLADVAKEAEHLGISVNRVDAAKIELANDAVERAKGVFTGLGNQLGTAFSPIIEMVANLFRQSALDTEDFGSIGQRVADALVKGYGKLLDAIHFIKIAFAAVKIPLLELARLVVDKVDPIFTFLAENYNAMAKVFGRDLIDETKLGNMAKGLTQDIGGAILGLNELMAKPLPSIALVDGFEEIKAANRRAAEEIANNAVGKKVVENKKDEVQKLGFFQEQELVGKKKLKEFNLMSTTAQTQHVIGELGNQFSAIATNNKKLFALNKAFQISNAIMDTYRGATLAMSSYPPPLNFAMAAATVASGLGQVAQIKAQSFDGGGMVPNGLRQGGADGIGGRFALLHPGEHVLTKKQAAGGGGVTIVNNVDAKGADAQTDMKIRTAMQQTSQQTVQIVQDLIRRGRLA